ncbi:hypothetical protein B1756_00570 [Natrarchaeobaculum aegyptiacum]|uniref:Uncharacterized protein n=1 Tax=Natrarchaeobaculum aegyptiacum TaxID=745377 RepID=A0A2Z2HNE4_9EURY|nr:hypothetical protein B1756_00570 [Natrarchaeobaculum aegyptiacum]
MVFWSGRLSDLTISMPAVAIGGDSRSDLQARTSRLEECFVGLRLECGGESESARELAVTNDLRAPRRQARESDSSEAGTRLADGIPRAVAT